MSVQLNASKQHFLPINGRLKPMRETTAISVIADREYVNAINCLARNKGTTVAALVRQALDKVHGDEIQSVISFFAETAASKQHQDASGQQPQS
jgi:hypothetical protein